MSDIKISIIIPVYNGEKYLKECLSSVISQTLKEIEIIIVDSNSTDSTPEIIKHYSATYDNIVRLVNNTLQHTVAHSRNMGLDLARGEYIMFLDADDFINIDYCQKLYNKAKTGNYDIVFSSRYDYFDGTSRERKVWIYDKDSIVISNDNMCEILLNAYRYFIVVWGRIVKKSILMDKNIRFFDNMSTGEDVPFTMLTFIHSKNATFVNDTYCYYRRNNDSLSTNVERMVAGMLESLKILSSELKLMNFSKKIISWSVCIPIVDILIGYFDKWNTGLFSRLSLNALKRIYPTIKNEYTVFLFDQEVLLNETRSFKIKYKTFIFSLKYNIYFLPKIVRIARNFIKLLPL